MILQPTTVELTKIRYYNNNNHVYSEDGEKKNSVLPTLSNTVFEKTEKNYVSPSNVIIKKNVFGHKWVLKINEVPGEAKKKNRRTKWKHAIAYSLVFGCILVALSFGLFLTLVPERTSTGHKPVIIRRSTKNLTDDSDFATSSATPANDTTNPVLLARSAKLEKMADVATSDHGTTTPTTLTKFCHNCTTNQICFKKDETEAPSCVTPLDLKDPTGCGGFCSLNVQFCQLLDDEHEKVYQCSDLKNRLKCPLGTFNCGNRCIAENKRCDGVIDCSNRSDETNCECNLQTHIRCGNQTSCLPKSKRCNGIVDCWDKSDEIDCNNQRACLPGFIQCHDGTCIPKDNFCDGIYHCRDRTDEPQGCQF